MTTSLAADRATAVVGVNEDRTFFFRWGHSDELTLETFFPKEEHVILLSLTTMMKKMCIPDGFWDVKDRLSEESSGFSSFDRTQSSLAHKSADQ
jgi:hypothetical protein